MAVAKQNGDVIPFVKQKDYIMVNNDLGGGSFGKTVLLQDPFIDELFVAKKYEPEYDGIKEQFYKNFLDEIKILYKLNHRNIVRIYNYYAYENIYTGYILMEYIDGENIGDFISDYFAPFAETTLDDVFLQLIDAFCSKKLEKKNAAFLTAFFDSLTNKEKLLDAQMPIRIFLSCASVQTAVEKKRRSETR